jgi:uncharacterized protein DUF4375
LVDQNKALIQLSESSRVALGRIPFSHQNPTQQVFTAVWELESEVNNGGFHQYFFNSSGDSAQGVLQALHTIGARNAERIVRDAIKAFPGGPPPADWSARQARLEVDDEVAMARWEELDREFFQYPDDLTSLLYAFVRAHSEEFGNVE